VVASLVLIDAAQIIEGVAMEAVAASRGRQVPGIEGDEVLTRAQRNRGTRQERSAVPTRRHRARGYIRNAVIGGFSLVVMLGVASYLTASSSDAWAMNISGTPWTGHFGEVLYGSATDESGHALEGVQISVWGGTSGDHGSGPLVVLVSGRGGQYRQVVSLPRGEYFLTVQSPEGGPRYGDDDGQLGGQSVWLDPGHAYCISVHQHHRGFFLFFPISSY
jgi:hypothetical protein